MGRFIRFVLIKLATNANDLKFAVSTLRVYICTIVVRKGRFNRPIGVTYAHDKTYKSFPRIRPYRSN